MIEKVIIAGSGGQGVMLLGKIMTMAAMKDNRRVTWLPSYGAEVRGGTAYCMVIMSDREIGSPYIEKADTLIVMNGPSLEKFKKRMADNGLLILNSSLSKAELRGGSNIIKYPFTDIAARLGNLKVANMVALGSYIAKKKITDIKTVFEVIEEIAPRDKKGLIEVNKRALFKGLELVRGR